MKKGKVTLIGAGPGDGGLITVKGLEALENADTVIYDRLVGEEILARISENAEKIDAGKSSSRHNIPQREINRLLLEKAAEGKNVARLKGGDCFLFGRGGEELELLYENGIDFEVIPGVTSALAVPAYAGIPVTHRDYASSVHIITGHAKAGGELDIDFGLYARLKGTLVFLMGVASMGYIINGLISHGMDRDTPCAVIECGTLRGQKKYIGTLGTITEMAKDVKSPAVITVGSVCALSSRYDWVSRLPLFGVTVAVTRQREKCGSLSDKLKKLGAGVIECPCIRTRSLTDRAAAEKIIGLLKKSQYAVFTSPAGVSAVMEGLYEAGADLRVFCGVRIAAVGAATAAELKRYGLVADIVPQTYSGAQLGRLLAAEAAQSDGILLLRAKKSARQLNEVLEAARLVYTELAVYETDEICERDISDEINSGSVDYVTFTCASAVRGFMKGHKNTDTDKFTAVCIGSGTAAEAARFGIRCITAERADTDSMVNAICRERSNEL